MRSRRVLTALLAALVAFSLACSTPRKRSGKKSDDESSEEDRPKKKKKKLSTESATTVPVTPMTASSTALQPPPMPAPTPPTPLGPTPTLTPPAPVPVVPEPTPPPPTPQTSEDRETVRRWVKEVVLGYEFAPTGKSRAGLVARWTKDVRITVMKGTSSEKALVVELAKTLDELLDPAGRSVEVVGDGDTGAEIKVWFTGSAAFDGLAKANGFKHVAGNDGYFYTFWNARFELERAYVLLATDKLSGDTLRHFTFEEITQALGSSTDSAVFSDSIFFADGSDGGKAADLGGRDRKLVSFLYTHLRPGDDRVKVDAAFDAHWR